MWAVGQLAAAAAAVAVVAHSAQLELRGREQTCCKGGNNQGGHKSVCQRGWSPTVVAPWKTNN